MKLGLAQVNTTVGDFAGNLALILTAYERGVSSGAELVVAPELAITGYPPRDLLLTGLSGPFRRTETSQRTGGP